MDLTLSRHQWLRFGTFTAFYFVQGVPIGLFSVALPIYFANAGATGGQVATYTSIIALPWAFKLVVGPLMDRFTFLPMGFRRPWVIGTQTGLALSLVVLSLFSLPGDPSILVLTIFGFGCNVFSASQDVATDGMAIDMLKENERGRANAFMACGQALGASSFGALSGLLLVQANVGVAAAVAALVIGIVWLIAILVRERPGEKRLPWTQGQPAEVEHRSEASIFSIIKDLLRVFFLPMSLILILMEFLNRVNDGIAVALYPKYAAEVLSISTPVYTSFAGAVGLVAALVGLLVGPFIDKFGVKRLLIIVLLVGAALRLVAWVGIVNFDFGVQELMVLYIAASIVGQFIFVATIAIFMTICWTRIAATQFSVYMSLANLSRSIGGFAYAAIVDRIDLHYGFLIMSGLLFLAAWATVYFVPGKQQQDMERLTEKQESAA